MIKNYFIVAFRTLRRNLTFSLINIFGLAIGLSGCLLIFLFVYNELNYDRFHEKAGQIFRANLRFNMGANQFDTAFCPVPLGPTMLSEYPEVLKSTRLFTLNYRNKNVHVKYREKQFKEKGFLWADSTVFEVFTIPLLVGDPNTVLENPNSVVLTPVTAEKYFGREDPVGKMLTLHDGSLYIVTGIAKEMPSNSHFKFDFLASFSSLKKSRDPEWYDTAVYTYVVLQKNFERQVLNKKLHDFSRKYVAPVIERGMGMSYDKFIEAGNYFGFFIEPMLDVHLYSSVGGGLSAPGNIDTVIIFSAIAILILLVACINFINLATARSTLRANEVGVRKVVGSNRRQLIQQFLVESIIYSIISLFLALIIMEIALPFMNNFMGNQLTSDILMKGFAIPALLGLVMVVGISAGIYPAFLLSAFQPVEVLKGKIQTGIKGRKFRNILAVFQFTASIILIMGTLVIYNQLHFVRNKNLGFNKEQVVVIPNAVKLDSKQQTFKNNLKLHSGIINATYTDCLPQMMLEVKPFQKVGPESHENHTLITISTDYDFTDTYQIEIVKGRFFNEIHSTDTLAVLLNEAAVKSLNFHKPLDEKLILLGPRKRKMDVIGVIKDFHLEPLHLNIRPMASILKRNIPGEFLSVRIKPQKIQETLKYIEARWNRLVPQQPFEYVFFDDQFEQIYQNEIRSGKIFTVFSVLAIFIACLGLFGLASFTALNKTKEIGIRKVLGASASGIFIQLSKQFIKWVLFANIFAWPIAWYVMNRWLQNFAYRINIGLWSFVLAGTLALVIALLTVSYQAIRAAIANPVDALRYE